jgi:glycosyltransferase involved in cell wall biosynthesis
LVPIATAHSEALVNSVVALVVVSPTARPTVAIDVTPLLGARSGIGNAVAETVAALVALEAGPEIVPYTLSFRARRQRDAVPPDTRFVPIPARVLLRAWPRSDQPRIDRWIKPAQVIHATNYLTPPSALPTVVSVFDCSFVRYPELCTPEVRMFEPIVRRAIQRGATVHTSSEFVADEIEEIFGGRLRATGRLVVIPLGVPPSAPEVQFPAAVPATLKDTPYVLEIATIEPRKNLPHLVQAFGTISADEPDLHLVIAGHDGPARPAVDDAIARLPETARARVLLPGAVSDAEKRGLLQHARLLAYPSIYEGFGFPVLEAMDAGVPVVTARAGSIPEVAGDAAILVDPTDEHALAMAIRRVLIDDDVRSELIARGRDRVRHFSWENTARALTSTYRALADTAA